MLRNLPTAYRTDPWILALCGAVQILLEELGRETAELPVQIRLSELTWQLPVEERLAGLSPRSGASLEDRRSAVIAKWRSGGPVTLTQIQAVADAWRNGVVEVGFDGSTITVTFVGELGIPEDLDGLKAALEMTIPPTWPCAMSSGIGPGASWRAGPGGSWPRIPGDRCWRGR